LSDVQGWLNAPATNFGWDLINLDEATPTDFRAFYTREFTDPALRPQLQIIYTPPAAVPEPATMVLMPLGMFAVVLGSARARRCNRSGNS